MRPLILVTFAYSSLSGGYKRMYEILKRGKSVGIDYIIVTDSKSCENAVKIFPDFMEILRKYRVIKGNFENKDHSFPGLKQLFTYKRILSLALFVSKIAKREAADLIISPSEVVESVMVSYLASLFCSKPWTAIFQPTSDLLQPYFSKRSINPVNVFAHINSKTSVNNESLISKIGLSIDLLSLLKIAEKTSVLAVSESVVEEFGYLNPRIEFLSINPGNGIDFNNFPAEPSRNFVYHAIFFARLMPEKGIFDLVKIWKQVTKKLPNAKLVVCGITERKEALDEFLREVRKNNLNDSIKFLGWQEEFDLFRLIRSSFLTVYPSYLDSFSLVTLESLALGIPVIAYNLPAIRHNFGKCKAVMRCPIGDTNSMANTILYVLSKADRSNLANEARRYASSYDWNQVVRAEREAYCRVINRGNR